MLLLFSYESKWVRAALLLVPGETCILVGEGAILKSETKALGMAGCLHLESEDNETYLGMWLCELSELIICVRLLAHNRYSTNSSYFENAQDCFPSPTMVSSSGIHHGMWQKAGQHYTGAGLNGPTLPLQHAPENLRQGSVWQLDRVHYKSSLYS